MAPGARTMAGRIERRTLFLAPRAHIAVALTAAVLAVGFALATLPLSWLVLGLGGSVLALVTAIRPHWTLYLLAFAVPFGSLFEVAIGPITVGVTEALLGWMLLAWTARHIALREMPVRVPPLAIPILAFIGVALYSLLNATSLPLAAKELLKWLEVVAVMVLVYNATPSRQIGRAVAALLAAGLLQALLGVYQFLTQSGPEGFVLRGQFMRAYGSFQQPNPYAGYLGLVAPLALAAALGLLVPRARAAEGESHSAARWSPWLEWFALAVTVLVAAAIGMSWSRGAWIAFVAAALVVTAVQSRRARAMLGAGLGVGLLLGLIGGIAALPTPVTERLTSFLPFLDTPDVAAVEVTDANYATLERLAHWQSALDMWRDHPWLGVGFGNYAVAYPAYALPKWPTALGHAHNYYLNIAAETGLLGLLAYLCLWAIAFLYLWRVVRVAPGLSTRALALGALGMLVHVSVHNIVDNLWVHNMYIHVAIVLGLVQAARRPGSVQTT